MGFALIAVDADWEESAHPRAPDGRFGSGGGSSKPRTLDLGQMKQVAKKPGGSLPGAVYQDADGARWLVKHARSEDLSRNEVLAGKLYEAAGVRVPELALVKAGGKTYVGSRMIEGYKGDPGRVRRGDAAIGEGLPVDAWLANWDVAGLEHDNVGFVGEEPVRIDLGGALRYRAQGSSKGAAFGPEPTELKTLRDPKLNRQSAEAFSKVTPEQLRKGAERLAKVTDDQVRGLVEDLGPRDEAEREKLAETLVARKAAVLRQLGVKVAQDAEWDESKHERDAQGKFAVSAGTKQALEAEGFKAKEGENPNHFHHPSGAKVEVGPKYWAAFKHGFPVGKGAGELGPEALQSAVKDAAEKAKNINDFILKAVEHYPHLSNWDLANLVKKHFKSNTTDKSVASVKSVAKKKAASAAAVNAKPSDHDAAVAKGQTVAVADSAGYKIDSVKDDGGYVMKKPGSDDVLHVYSNGKWKMSNLSGASTSWAGNTAGGLIAHLNATVSAPAAASVEAKVEAAGEDVSKEQQKGNGEIFDSLYGHGFAVTKKVPEEGINYVANDAGVKGWYKWKGPNAGDWVLGSGEGAKAGHGAAQLKQALHNVTKQAPVGTKSQASEPKKEIPLTTTSKQVKDVFKEQGYEHKDLTTVNGATAELWQKGNAFAAVDVSGKWTLQTPGHVTKVGDGPESLKQLLSGTKPKNPPWTNSPGTNLNPATQAGPIKPDIEDAGKAAAAGVNIETTSSEGLRQKIAAHRPKLSAAESAAMQAYKGNGYVAINNGLRHQKGYAEKSEHVKNLDAAMARATIPFETTLYRKVGSEYAKILKSISMEGTTFVERGYTSSATSKGVWSGDLHFTIKVPAGTHGMTARPGSSSDGEQEVVLARGTKYVVEEYDDHSHTMVVRAVQDHLPMWQESQAKAKQGKEAA